MTQAVAFRKIVLNVPACRFHTYNGRVNAAFALIVLSFAVMAQAPVEVQYACPAEDIDSFGLSCAPEEPCPIFLELAAVESAGAKLFVTGNLHTESTTLYGILLASEDGGRTWTEPVPRMRAASFEQIQFIDLAHGWISGQIIEPLPRDPFLLITADGGKTWKQKSVFDDSRFGSIAQFWFDSLDTGRLIVDHSGAHDVYETHTGGESWEMEQSSNQAVTLKGRRLESNLRLRADGKVFHLERRGDGSWEAVTRFKIHVTDCQ